MYIAQTPPVPVCWALEEDTFFPIAVIIGCHMDDNLQWNKLSKRFDLIFFLIL